MKSFLQAVFVLFLLSFHRQGNATRYLPTIVWDHLNPMLSCKCNWFDITKLEIYDRFDFVCPTLKINVLLLDSHSRPEDQMNLNIFMRKWKGGIDDNGLKTLQDQMESGDFCDPNHNETEKLYTCRNGKSGQGKTVRFAKDNDFYKNDLVVFFNNGNDGRTSTLSSNEKECAMAFVVNVTWNVAMKYDFSYGKNLNNKREECKIVNTTCFETTPQPSTETTSGQNTISTPNTEGSTTTNTTTRYTNKPTTKPTTKLTNLTTKPTTKPATKLTTKPTTKPTTKSTTKPITINNKADTGERTFSEEWDKFKYGFLVGFATMLLLIILAALTYCVLCRPPKKKRTKTNCICQYKVGDQVQSTIVSNLGSENEAQPLPKKTPAPKNQGINNNGFHGTLKRDSVASSVGQYKAGGDQCQSTVVNNLGSENEAQPLPKKTSDPKNQGINNIGYHDTLKRDSVAE